MPCDVSTLITGASTSGYYGLEDRSVLLAMAGLLSNVTGYSASQALAGAVAAGFSGLQEEQLYQAIVALCA